MDTRRQKAEELVNRGRVVRHNAVTWWVFSLNSPNQYRVILNPDGDTCACDDFDERGLPCKHILAARIMDAREKAGIVTEPVTDTPPIQFRKPTYRQVWPAYNAAQQVEKERFRELLFDLTRCIEEPPPKPGRGKRPLPLRDAIFAAIYKIYSTFSGRRFMTDLNGALEQGFLSGPVSYNSIFKCLESEAVTPILHALIERSSLPLRSVDVDFAADASGFSTCRYTRWYDQKYGRVRLKCDWVKVHLMVGVKTNVVTAAIIGDKDANECPMLPPLVNAAAKNFTVNECSADKGFCSRGNAEAVAAVGGTPFIPFKSNVGPDGGGMWERMYHFFHYHREEFMAHYHKRSNVESTFSAIKRKLGDSVRSKTDVAMKNEVLGKLVAYNICCVIQEMHELGIEAEFWPEKPGEGPEEDGPAILPMVRPG